MDTEYPPEKIVSILKTARLFNQFDEAQLIQLMGFATIEHFEKGTKIIRENEINKDIYILLKGSLVIYVGDELILKLRRRGDIIGEMSVITKSVTTASVVADTNVVLFKIPSRKIYESDQESLRSQWFKIFSDILAQKLSMTNKKVIGFHEASTRLDEKKRELIHKTLILQSVLGSMDDGVVVTDGTGRVLHANKAFVRMTGNRAVPVSIQDWPDRLGFFQSDRKTACTVENLPMTRAEKGILTVSKDYYIKNKNMKNGVWLQATSSLLKTDEGKKLEGSVVVFRNVTQKKQEEKALIRAKENAEATAKAKSDFLSVMSHELRTPLNAIIGAADLLMATALTSEQSKHIGTINQGGRTLLAKVKNILFYNSLESGNVQIIKERMSLKETIKQVINSHLPAARKKKLAIDTQICEAADQRLFADREKIIIILDNLLDNGLKYTGQGRVLIRVDIAEQNKANIKFRLMFEDTGPGISKTYLENLFEPFSQEDISLSRKFEGTGLGLSITKKVVGLMGGQMEVKSVPGKGSCFSFTLIMSRQKGSIVQETSTRKPVAKSLISKDFAKRRPLNILVAEDNKVNLLLIKKVLANLGYNITAAQNGREALDICRTRHFDLVLMDIQMPEMDGLTAAEAILKQDLSGPLPVIVALTANTSEGIRQTCLDAGMKDYIAKPLDVETLAAVIESLPFPKGPKDTDHVSRS